MAVIELLIKNKAVVNIRSEYGWTALHISSFNGREDIVQFLIENGASTNIKSNNDSPALRNNAEKGIVSLNKPH